VVGKRIGFPWHFLHRKTSSKGDILKNLFEMNSVQRTVVLWIAFMAILWIVFGIGLVTHPNAYTHLPAVGRETGWRVATFILGSNGVLMLLIFKPICSYF
jgi:hypothetical protein